MDLFKLFGTIAVKNDEANDAIDDTTDKAERSEGRMSGAFKKIGTAVAAAFAIDKIVDFGRAIVDASATVAAEQSAFEQIMGDYSKSAQKKVTEIADATGMVDTRLTPYMTSLTAKFKGLGYGVDEATTLAQDGLLLAADASAFWDKSLDDAMSGLNSFINGSYEGGEAIGLFANDTQLASYAVKEGIVSETKEWASLAEAKKQATRLEFAKDMMKASGATGQAAKEADQYANVQANMNEEWRQFKAVIGTPLLDALLPILKGVTDALSGMNERLKGSNNIFEGFASLITDIIAKAHEKIPEFVKLAGDMMLKFGESIKAKLPEVTTKALDMIEGFVDMVAENLPILIQAGVGMLQNIAQGIADTIPTLIARVPTIITKIANLINDNAPTILMAGVNIIITLGKGILNAIPALLQNIPKIFEAIWAVWNAINWINLGKSLIGGIKNGIKNAGEGLKNNVKQLFENIKVSIENIFKNIQSSASNIWNAVKNNIVNIANNLKMHLTNIVNAIKTGVVNAWEAIKAVTNTVFYSIKNIISTIWNGIKLSITGIANGIKSSVSSVWNGIKSVTTSVWNGIKNAIQNPMETAKNLVKKIIDTIKGFFNFKISWPKIPLPHFSIKPKGWDVGDLLKGKIPSLGISWYAKGGIFDQPTIFPTAQGLKGVGEAGAEAVTPISVLLDYVRTAVQEENGGMTARLDRLIRLLEEYMPSIAANMGKDIYLDTGELVGALGGQMDGILGDIAVLKERGIL